MTRCFAKKTHVRCMVTGKDIISGEKAVALSIRGAKMIRSRFQEITRKNTGSVEDVDEVSQEEKEEFGQELLRKNPLSTWPSFLKTFMESDRVQKPCIYSVFTFEPLHNLPFRIPKLLKVCTVRYLSSNRLTTGVVQKIGRSFLKI